jgi:DNA-binding transcriptional regulator YdaS (Cro superfamily)
MKNSYKHSSPLLKKLINLFGTQEEIAARCNLHQAAISKWFSHNKIPLKRALIIEKITNRKIKSVEVLKQYYKD